MIGGLGVDIVSIPRISRAWARFGNRFAKKFLSPTELVTLSTLVTNARQQQQQQQQKSGLASAEGASDRPAVQFLASRWAAKEAAFKALGPSFPRVLFTEISVEKKTIDGNLSGENGDRVKVQSKIRGAPCLVLHGSAARVASDKGLARSFLSISHDGDYAFAQVIFEKV